ncbi:MAG: Mth938-like domain-containing protein, partial [Hyphomonadaceae bacterium]|nr:Mth938-like domain-containing protein [Hyphomonadaceae bacterium]
MQVIPVLPAGGRPMLTAYGAGGFRFGETRIEGDTLVVLDEPMLWQAGSLAQLTLDHFTPVLAVEGERRAQFVLLGTGKAMAPPPSGLAAGLSAAGIGLEFMDTPNACRIYNTLTGEGRNFAAALLA